MFAEQLNNHHKMYYNGVLVQVHCVCRHAVFVALECSRCSSGSGLDFHDTCELGLPLVTVLNKLLLVVEQLLVQESGVLEVGALNNGVDGASLLAESTEDALGHIDVVLGSSTGAIRSGLTLDGDGESRASGFAQLASNATLLTGGVAAQSVLTTEHGTERTLLPRVMDDVIRFEGGPSREEQRRPGQLGHEDLTVHVLSVVGSIRLIGHLISGVQTDILLVVQTLRIEGLRVVVLAVGHLGVQVVYAHTITSMLNDHYSKGAKKTITELKFDLMNDAP